MIIRCDNCGAIHRNINLHKCSNCKSDTKDFNEDLMWYNRYASERMTKEEAIEFFETNKY